MDSRQRLIQVLADGRFHSGQALGEKLGVSRAMVWKLVRRLREDLAAPVHGVVGKGYRLAEPVVLLAAERIREHLGAPARGRLPRIEVRTTMASTNRRLMELAAQGAPGGAVALAEHQSGGRGRRGRSWESPFGQNLYLSLLWRYARLPVPVSALSIVAGVAVVRALEALGHGGLALKWPNDVVAEGGKLAGILLEMGGEPAGPCHVVVGVGLNVNMTRASTAAIDQPWTSLRLLGGRPLDRNPVAAALLTELVDALADFGERGLAEVAADWRRLDLTRDHPIGVHTAAGVVAGVGQGIDETGALRVATPGGLRIFHSGEVSVRIRR